MTELIDDTVIEKKCKFCNKKTKLIEAHILPKWSYRYEVPLRKIPKFDHRIVSKNEHMKKLPKGIYDKNILCAECDGKLGIYDNYGKNIFNDYFKNAKEMFDETNGNRVLIVNNIDEDKYMKIKLFYLSILYRMSISSDLFFRNVKLGCYEDMLLNLLKESNPCTPEDFSMIFAKLEFTNEDRNTNMIKFPPVLIKRSINRYLLRFNGFAVWIKVDKRKYDKYIYDSNLILRPNYVLYICIRDFFKGYK
jgi:hypothetical protein